MNTKVKYAIVAIVLLALVCTIGYLMVELRKERISNIQAMTQVQLSNTILSKTRDKLNREVATYKAYQFTLDQLNAMNDSTITRLRIELSYWKHLVSHTSVESTTTDTLKMPVHDTVYKTGDSTTHAKVFSWDDQWLTLNGTVASASATVSYSLRNKSSVDYYWKRDHWWTREYLQGTVTQENPNTITNKVVQFTVPAADKKWYEKWWVWMLIGGGAGGTGMYFILK